ncbi:MAG: Uma2 family endonuclease [Solirubrobacterales bacterium]|nr:Uma2 family endonuclease [Solirubrobacterales bacterium]
MTVAEFLAWEERQDLRYEFDGFRPVAMTGGTRAHDIVANNLRASLHRKLAGSKCRYYGPDMKIEAAGSIRYPDAFVSCSLGSATDMIIGQPVVVIEVVSESTARTDRIDELRDYFATPCIQRYVIIEQTSTAATLFVRESNGWKVHPLTAEDVILLPEVGIELPITELYVDIAFPETEEQSR